jgi:hypothetical protein
VADIVPEDQTPKLDYAAPGSDPWSRRRTWVIPVAFTIICAFALRQVLTPAIYSSTGPSNRVRSVTNLKQIGTACMLYCNDNGGEFPDSFQAILLNEDMTANVFVSPSSNDTPATGSTPRAIADQLMSPGHCSYIYLGRRLNGHMISPDCIIAYESLADYKGQGTYVLYGDQHVEFQDAATALKIAAEAAAGMFPIRQPSQ